MHYLGISVSSDLRISFFSVIQEFTFQVLHIYTWSRWKNGRNIYHTIRLLYTVKILNFHTIRLLYTCTIKLVTFHTIRLLYTCTVKILKFPHHQITVYMYYRARYFSHHQITVYMYCKNPYIFTPSDYCILLKPLFNHQITAHFNCHMPNSAD